MERRRARRACVPGAVYPGRQPRDSRRRGARAPAGAALVVDVGEERELGYWGEVLTTAAEARGLAGLVIDGCVRDVAALAASRVSGVLHRPRAAGRDEEPRRVGQPIGGAVVGDVDVHPGDWVVGDGDGVVVVPGGHARAGGGGGTGACGEGGRVLRRARAGATTLDLLGLDAGVIDGA